MTLIGDVGDNCRCCCRSVGLRIPDLTTGSFAEGAKVTWVNGVSSDDEILLLTVVKGYCCSWPVLSEGMLTTLMDSSSTSSISVNVTPGDTQGMTTSSVPWGRNELLIWSSMESWVSLSGGGGRFNLCTFGRRWTAVVEEAGDTAVDEETGRGFLDFFLFFLPEDHSEEFWPNHQ